MSEHTLPEHHRQQSQENVDRINAIKQAEKNLLELIGTEGRENSIAVTNIQTGVMWAIRHIAAPKF